MVLIQLLLPTSGAASADGLAPLAQTRGSGTGSRVSRTYGPDHLQRDCGRLLTGGSHTTTSLWWKSWTDTFDLAWAHVCGHAGRAFSIGRNNASPPRRPVELLDEGNR